RAEELGDPTVSMLKGELGHQRKEIDKLAHWLATEVRPELINLTNALLSGLVREVKARLGVPLLCTLQGDDVFLESLPEPYRAQSLELIRTHCRQIDGFIATSRYYAEFMSNYLAIPRDRIHVIYPGLNLSGHAGSRRATNGPPYTIGYFARICPEKGLHTLAQAFRILCQTPGTPPCRLRVSGWLGSQNRAYLAGISQQLKEAGLSHHF